MAINVPAVDDANTPLSSGLAFITWKPFVGNDGKLVSGGSKTATIANGQLSVSLTASDNAGYVYQVLLQSGGKSTTELWRVPASGVSSMAQLMQILASPANQVHLDLRTMQCSAETDGAPRRINSGAGESLHFCLSSYADPHIAALWDALAQSSSKVVRVVLLGDSITGCWAANCAGTGPVSQSSLWSSQFASYIRSHYPSHGSGLLPLFSQINGAVISSLYSITPAYTPNVLQYYGPYQSEMGSLVGVPGGSTVRLTQSFAGDHVAVNYAYGSAPDNGQGFHVIIDGADQGTFGTQATQAGTVLAGRVVVPVPAGNANAQHSLSLVVNGTASNHCYFSAVEWLSGAVGASVDVYAIGGARAEMFGSQPQANLAFLDQSIAPGDLVYVVMMLGTNDYLAGVPTAQYGQYLSAVLAHFAPRGLVGSAVLVAPWAAMPGGSISQDQYAGAAYGFAKATGSYFFSFADAFGGSLAAQQRSCRLSDNLHPDDACQQAMWTALRNHMTNKTYAWYPVRLGAPLTQ